MEQVSSLRLSQSKSYLKIVGIPYISEKSNICISSNEVENILKNNYVFNNIVLISKPQIIKVSPKLDMAIIWINIWDMQNGSNMKKIINRHFNIGSFITMICGANINLDVSQCKNCWNRDHMAEVCHIQGAKCIKYNGPHLTDHHHHFAWCCKANDKINSPRLKTKKSKSCPHTFKCFNCKGNYQADSNKCLFWKHCFNKEWHAKEYSKLWETRRNSICLAVNTSTIWF